MPHLPLLSGAPVIPVGIHLLRERCHVVRSRVKGNDEYGRWYLRRPYAVTVGQPLRFTGDIEYRPYVRQVAETVIHPIIEMACLSEIRMTRTPTPLASLPNTL